VWSSRRRGQEQHEKEEGDKEAKTTRKQLEKEGDEEDKSSMKGKRETKRQNN